MHTHEPSGLAGRAQVLDVHDLHVWTLVGSKVNVWAHLTVESGADQTRVLFVAAHGPNPSGKRPCFPFETSTG